MYHLPNDSVAALNAVNGVTRVQLRGRNSAISNSAETVWISGATYAVLTSAVAMQAVSSNANDTSAGTGARTIQVVGVGAGWALQTETVTMNGVTPVALANTYIGINSVRVLTAGSGLTNAGNITIQTTAGATPKALIATGPTLSLGQSSEFIYTVPAGYYGLLKRIEYSATGVTGDLTVYLNSTDSAGILRNEAASKSSLYVTGFNGAQGVMDFGGGLVISEKTCIELRAIVSAGAGDLVAMGELYLISTTKSNLVN